MNILKKLFCKHQWKSHAKEVYEWDETIIIKGTELWYSPITEKHSYSKTNEVLICSCCGKIKIIEY